MKLQEASLGPLDKFKNQMGCPRAALLNMKSKFDNHGQNFVNIQDASLKPKTEPKVVVPSANHQA